MSASQSEATKKQEEIDRLEAMISRELFERHPDELEADSRLQRAVYAQDTLVASSFFLPRRRRGGVDERGHQEAAFVAHQGSLKLRPDVDFGEVCYTEGIEAISWKQLLVLIPSIILLLLFLPITWANQKMKSPMYSRLRSGRNGHGRTTS